MQQAPGQEEQTSCRSQPAPDAFKTGWDPSGNTGSLLSISGRCRLPSRGQLSRQGQRVPKELHGAHFSSGVWASQCPVRIRGAVLSGGDAHRLVMAAKHPGSRGSGCVTCATAEVDAAVRARPHEVDGRAGVKEGCPKRRASGTRCPRNWGTAAAGAEGGLRNPTWQAV